MDERITRAVIGALRERDRSGHDLWHWLGPRHGAQTELTEANLYPTLYRLEGEHLIGGEWREGERTRRVYRVSSRGLELVRSKGWPPIARRMETDPILTLRTDEQQADDPRSGAAPVQEGATEAQATDTGAGEAEAARSAEATAVATAEPEDGIRGYVARLDAGLQLSEPHRNDVLTEIRDHLEDCSAELVGLGFSRSEAVAEALARLGPPEALAAAANEAQLDRRRLQVGLQRAGIGALLGMALGLAGAGTIVSLMPIVGRLLTVVGGVLGIHLYVPEDGESRAQQLFAAVAVGAFLAGRRSMPFVAVDTRRAEAVVRPLWALAGGIPLAAFAVLEPAMLDPLTAATMLCCPMAFAAGTWMWQRPGDDLLTRRGVVATTLLLVVFLLLPGFRLWAFDPASAPRAGPPAATSVGHITWEDLGSGSSSWRVSVSGLDQSTWHEPELEFWPAARQGVTVVADDRTAHPSFTISPGDRVDLGGYRDHVAEWWVSLTAVGPDGVRHAITADVQVGNPDHWTGNILGWILEHD